jgi:hypothetical protein
MKLKNKKNYPPPKKITYIDHVGFIEDMQGWFSIYKSNLILHINIQRQVSHDHLN